MNTNKIDLIKAEVEKIAKSINLFAPDEDGKNSSYEEGRLVVALQILQIIDSMQQESVSNPIDFEKELYKAFGQVKDFTLGMRIAKWFYDMGKNSQEPVGEDLGEYINELSKQFPEVSFAKLSRIAVRVAKWQITKLMKDATEVTVHIDAGGYPYTPEIELYDYDKDVPLAKEGDKYKVVLIKEV